MYQIIIELSKEDSSFLYFTLEANEGLCFYSTKDHHNGDPNRTVEIYTHPSMKDDLVKVIEYFRRTHPSTIKSEQFV